jgi:hypothetical protein
VTDERVNASEPRPADTGRDVATAGADVRDDRPVTTTTAGDRLATAQHEAVVAPTREDPLARVLSPFLGGPAGSR